MSGPHRHRSFVDVHVLLLRDGRVAMLRRANTGYGDGLLHLPSGHLDEGESVVLAAVREAAEETGVKIEPVDLRWAHVLHFGVEGGADRVGFFFVADRWAGEPYNREPDKASELVWVDPTNLPEDTIAYPATGIANVLAGVGFATAGWD